MFIKRTTSRIKGKTYINHLLVQSVATSVGPRHKVICSLGRLDPGPKEQWLTLARKLEAALSGQTVLNGSDSGFRAIVKKVGPRKARPSIRTDDDVVAVHSERIEIKDARAAGPVHVGHQMWERLEINRILQEAGLPSKACLLSQAMTLNRLVQPSSEHAMPDWIRRTAMADILKVDFSTLRDTALYRNLDRLHPKRALIEKGLAEREKSLFNLDDTIWLYDLTSTYFEGDCPFNPQAKRGYSRDSRPDCKQVVVGLVLGTEGFPKAHEVFDGNTVDHKTVDKMLDKLEERAGRREGVTVVVDRGLAYAENLRQILKRGYHYIVAGRQTERIDLLSDFEDEADWYEVHRPVSPRNPGQKKTRVAVKRRKVGGEVFILCRSDGRIEKDRAIRDKHETRLRNDLKRMEKRIAKGRLKELGRIHEAIGRIKERYPRVARYYVIEYDASQRSFLVTEAADKKKRAQQLDGTYLLKTDRKDLSDEEVWKTYIMLTRVESAFRSMKSPLMERPIFHQIEKRVQTHVFLCVLAYHLLVAIEKMFLDQGVHTSWQTLREQLSTHQVVTVCLPTPSGKTLEIRKGTTPEAIHKEIYRILRIPQTIMRPVRHWVKTESIVTEENRNSFKTLDRTL
jgi:transposase